MRVTTWTEYSLIIALHLARRGRSGSGATAARELAEVERLPGDYVEQILLPLRRAGLGEGVRGAPSGGFSIRPVWHARQRRVDDLLSSISLAALLKDQPPTSAPELVPLSMSPEETAFRPLPFT